MIEEVQVVLCDELVCCSVYKTGCVREIWAPKRQKRGEETGSFCTHFAQPKQLPSTSNEGVLTVQVSVESR